MQQIRSCNMNLTNEKINILNVKIDDIGVQEVIDFINQVIAKKKKAIISYANIHALNLCYESNRFREFINTSDLVFCDGFGIHLGARLLGKSIHHRLTPPDWIDLLCESAMKNNWSLFFLGARPGVAQLAATKLMDRHQGLKISVQDGYFEHFGEGNQEVLRKIQESNAKVILVGMGMPLQEFWIEENYQKIPNAAVFIPVGAMFDYVANTIPRGPRILTDHGLEWLARLFIEPGRLWCRYVIGIPLFFFRILFYKFLN